METAEGITLSAELAKSSNFWQHIFAALSEQGTIQAWFTDQEETQSAIINMTKLYGFIDVQCSNPNFQQGKIAVVAKRPAFKVGGTSLKRKKKPAAEAPASAAASENPWANLGTTETGLINEDSLMVDEAAIQAVTEKFANDSDRIMPGKPCDDCTCGKKDVYEGSVQVGQSRVTIEALETGQLESSCGKCYLGDAFRCGGCPFRGTPAFEPGDKVKLMGTDTASATADASMVKAATVNTAATGSTKVVLEL